MAVTLLDTFQYVWKMDTSDNAFAIYAIDAGLPSAGVLYEILAGRQKPDYMQAVKIMKWFNDRVLPPFGVKHKYCLGDLFPDQWPRPAIRDEVMMILGISSRRGKTMTKDEVVALVGDEHAKKVCGKNKEIGTEEMFNYLKENEDIEVLVTEGVQILK